MKKLILSLIIILGFTSCNTTKSHLNENDYLILHDLTIKDKEFLNLIEQSADNYNKKYKEFPRIIQIEIVSKNEKDNDSLYFYITSEYFLYVNQKDKLFFNENFIALGEVKKIPVIVKNIGGKHQNFEKYFKVGHKKIKFNVEYGGITNSCTQAFRITNEKIIIESNDCLFNQ